MKDFVIKVKIYKDLLHKYNPPESNRHIIVELMLICYNSKELIKYPECWGYTAYNITKRSGLNVFERLGYIQRVTKRKRHYKLTFKGEYLCRDFMADFKNELLKYNITI